MKKDTRRIDHRDLHTVCLKILTKGGVDEIQAKEVANNLLWSELVGRENFGLLRLPVYLDRVKHGGIKCPCVPSFIECSPTSAILNADAGFGQYAAKLAVEHAIQLAQSTGVGIVGVRNSNFFGTGAYFVHQIAEQGMIGLVMSNSFPKVTAHNGLVPVLGTNPFAFGAPLRNGESLMFDMATSALAGSTVREHAARKKPLPEGLAIDANGKPIIDPASIDGGALLPAAGAKGYGLSLMVEILAGVLTGAGVSKGVASMYKDVAQPGDNGHFMIVLDISRFMVLDLFFERLEYLTELVKASNQDGEVLLPGEIRWKNYKSNLSAGIKLGKNTRDVVSKLCAQMGIDHGLAPALLDDL